MLQLQSLFGLFLLAAIAWSISENRKAVRLRWLLAGILLQLVLAFLLLKLPLTEKPVPAPERSGTGFTREHRKGDSLCLRLFGGWTATL